MSRIDIAYGAEHRIKQACQTVYKHFLAGRHVLVYCTDPKRLEAFNKMLWSVEETGFVPHPYLGEGGDMARIHLCHTLSTDSLEQWEGGQKPWLLNLDINCPPFFEQFDRVLEIISTHPEDRRLARERVAVYKQGAHQIVYHDLTPKA